MNDKQKNPPALRRKPSQTRSREKVELILGCATALIARQGSDAMRMSEVAQNAGISIGRCISTSRIRPLSYACWHSVITRKRVSALNSV